MTTSYKRLSFTNDEEEILIKFIKQHPALWDASHPEYSNGELRKRYWFSLSKELDKSVHECRRKWRFIRDYYIHKRRRTTSSSGQRDGKYFNLHFLDKVSVRKFATAQRNDFDSSHSQQDGNINKDLPSDDNSMHTFKQACDEYETQYAFAPDTTFENVTMERVEQSNDFLLDDEEEPLNRERVLSADSPRDFVSNSDFRYDEDSTNNTVIDGVHKVEDIDEEHLLEAPSDLVVQQTAQATISMRDKAIDLFFESMAAAVKMFPQEFVAEAKLKVLTAINEVEARVHGAAIGK